MDKKTEGHNSEKGAGRDAGHGRPDRERGSGKNEERGDAGARHENRERGSGASEFRERSGVNREPGADASDYSQKAEAKRAEDFEKSDYRYRADAEKLAEEGKKSSCLPKLLILIAPFVAAGTYLFLRS